MFIKSCFAVEVFPDLQEQIAFMKANSIRKTGEIVPAGRGSGDIKAIFDKLRSRGRIFLNLEPHLAAAGILRGFQGLSCLKRPHRPYKYSKGAEHKL